MDEGKQKLKAQSSKFWALGSGYWVYSLEILLKTKRKSRKIALSNPGCSPASGSILCRAKRGNGKKDLFFIHRIPQ
jgi:hypothetical protein